MSAWLDDWTWTSQSVLRNNLTVHDYRSSLKTLQKYSLTNSFLPCRHPWLGRPCRGTRTGRSWLQQAAAGPGTPHCRLATAHRCLSWAGLCSRGCTVSSRTRAGRTICTVSGRTRAGRTIDPRGQGWSPLYIAGVRHFCKLFHKINSSGIIDKLHKFLRHSSPTLLVCTDRGTMQQESADHELKGKRC